MFLLPSSKLDEHVKSEKYKKPEQKIQLNDSRTKPNPGAKKVVESISRRFMNIAGYSR
jgi:hypothetical protein